MDDNIYVKVEASNGQYFLETLAGLEFLDYYRADKEAYGFTVTVIDALTYTAGYKG